MKIKIGKWYLNEDIIEDPHLVDNIEDASDMNQDEVDEFMSHFTDFEGECIYVISTKKWYNVYLNDIEIIN